MGRPSIERNLSLIFYSRCACESYSRWAALTRKTGVRKTPPYSPFSPSAGRTGLNPTSNLLSAVLYIRSYNESLCIYSQRYFAPYPSKCTCYRVPRVRLTNECVQEEQCDSSSKIVGQDGPPSKIMRDSQRNVRRRHRFPSV